MSKEPSTLLLLVYCTQAQLNCYIRAIDPESAFPRPPLSPVLMELCQGSMEIIGKM